METTVGRFARIPKLIRSGRRTRLREVPMRQRRRCCR